MPNVTIVTDASYCEHGKCGAWAVAVFVHEGSQMVNHAEPFDGPTGGGSSGHELRAIRNGLKYAIETGLILHGDRVVLCFDCQGAEHKLKNTYKSKKLQKKIAEWVGDPMRETPPGTPPHNSPVFQIRTLIVQYELDVEFLWIKGHPKKDQREASLVHSMMHDCDRAAHHTMRQERVRLGMPITGILTARPDKSLDFTRPSGPRWYGDW